jgi:mutator protein MutT
MEMLSQNPQIEWVQLPFAGVDAFSEVLALPIRFTSAKGAYRQPVAEHALALCLALGRAIPTRVRAKAWGEKFAKSLYESNVLVIGGGGITEELVKLLHPFGCSVTVVRKHPAMLLGNRTVGFEHLDSELATADYVVIAAALTDEKGQILLQKRPEGAQMGGLWEFPGGKVDNGESPEVALIRELEEELGITVAAQDLVPETFASAPLGDRNLVLLLYRCHHWIGTPKPIYATDIQWLLPQDMAVLPMPPADYPLVRKLQSL